MSRELRHIKIAFTVDDPEHLPTNAGEQMYADDVSAELADVVEAAVTAWYENRGKELLACEPLVC
ncbi:hypothetical protein [Streptomyces roseolus]|uniref:hypothetical protein n=1 Tax=Streptomyces roseolus TaxID=67358 RepID=UPI00167A7A1E|nr:hypothetical protein [Streptomyces roseolus]GGR51619.1 hypothetical protein GCM10010282_50680 [Streptomyces roseolus]